jgi:hypothetical protein
MASKPIVYIETTIPSYYFETRTSSTARAWRAATRKWWRESSDQFRLVTSNVTFLELTLAPDSKRLSGFRLMSEIEVVPESEEVIALRADYIENLAMPNEAIGDADHLAYASVYHADFLLTWNCKHLANANKFRHMSVINARYGLGLPTIVTPLQLDAK